MSELIKEERKTNLHSYGQAERGEERGQERERERERERTLCFMSTCVHALYCVLFYW